MIIITVNSHPNAASRTQRFGISVFREPSVGVRRQRRWDQLSPGSSPNECFSNPGRIPTVKGEPIHGMGQSGRLVRQEKW